MSSPGSTVGEASKVQSIKLIADCLNEAHRATKSVVTVLENMVRPSAFDGLSDADLIHRLVLGTLLGRHLRNWRALSNRLRISHVLEFAWIRVSFFFHLSRRKADGWLGHMFAAVSRDAWCSD